MAHIVRLGFDPRKPISTISYCCSECCEHCADTDEICQCCGSVFEGDMEWYPPIDIRRAMEKQKPMLVGLGMLNCPCCGVGKVFYGQRYCSCCGQALNWSEWVDE